METGSAAADLVASNGLIKFLRSEATLSPRKALTVAAVAGLTNAMILAVINTAAEHAEQSESRPLYAVFFAAAMILYVVSQRWILTQAAEQVEAMIHRVRMRIVSHLQYCELLDVEQLGRVVIYSGIARHMQTLSQSASTMTIAVQMTILILFTALYIAWISITSFIALVAFMSVALFVYWRKSYSVRSDLRGTLEMDNDVYNTIDDLLDGFKEAKLSRGKARAIIARIEEISQRASEMRGVTQIMLAKNFVFSQTAFYLLLGTMVFVVPILTSGYSDEVQKSTTAVLFIIGPISGLIGSIPIFENSSAAAEAIMDLERDLKRMSGVELAVNEDGKPLAEAPTADSTRFADFKTLELRKAVFRYTPPNGDPTESFAIGPIDLTVTRGEVLFITGGNGSGKSTLLRVLTGLYPLHEGTILVDGKALPQNALQDYREIFAAVFGDFHLFSELYGVPDEGLDEVADWIATLEILNKVKFDGQRFSTIDLSTGQRKRLALLAALLEKRPILVLDEWAADQDPMFRRKFYREILGMLRSRGATIIAVTHDNRFFDAADRQMHMEDGMMATFDPELFHD
ncbi:cyclic peptide export ABC transporter [Nisaea denitrificans]|uniref:cyclic peptide export ABC transporter n=1 Tax=Nisaea denitrificans TaxID=390877 RepID=UPI0003FE3DA6|nr:cyclic peptide export ABC transporter [Nisaea denitrificans]